MSKLIQACLCGILCLSGSPVLAAGNASAVLVTATLPDGRQAFASGVIVGEGGGLRIATAAHIARLADIEIHTQLGETLTVHDPHFVPGYDLAILETSPARSRYRAARPAVAITNEEVAEVWGYGAGVEPRMLPALIVAASIRFPGSENVSKIGFACDRCERGDSGAGIFDRAGALIGILAARWSERDGRLSMEGEPVSAVFEIMASK